MKDLDTLKLEGQINELHYEFDGCLMLCDVHHLDFIGIHLKREHIILIKKALEIAKETLK